MPQRTQRSYFRESTRIINPDGTITPGDRFLSTDEPTEETFKRLIESVTFVNEIEDRAKESEQGLVKITTGANAKSGSTPSDGATYAAQIKNLPTLKEGVQTIKDLQAVLVTAKPVASVTDRNDYLIQISSDFIQWLTSQLDTLTQSIGDISVPDISQLESDLDDLEQSFSTLSTTVNSQGSDISDNSSAISTLQTEMDAVESQAQANEDAIAAINLQDGSVVGEYKIMAVEGAPNASYLLCNGAAVSRSTYADLFAKIGTTFGAGNGSTTFNLPDFSGKGFRGYNASNETKFGPGVSGGSDESTIAANNLPEHAHGIDEDVVIPLADAAGSDATRVAKGDGSGADNLTINIDSNTEVNGTTQESLDVTNPYLTSYVYIKATA